MLLLAVAAHPSHAQATPLPTSPKLTVTSGDTIRAVQHLFERRRQGGKNWLYISVSGLLGVARVLASPTTTTVNGYQTKSEVDGGAAAVFGLGFLGLPAGIGAGKLVRFSDKRETEVINTYATTHRLPGAVRRRLRRKDF